MTQASPQTDAPARNRRKTEVGVVASDKMNKTRRVEIQRLVPHPKYGKYVRSRTVCHAHDEENATHVGDLVEIMETRPLSKTKRWRIVRVVRQGPQAALHASAAESAASVAPTRANEAAAPEAPTEE